MIRPLLKQDYTTEQSAPHFPIKPHFAWELRRMDSRSNTYVLAESFFLTRKFSEGHLLISFSLLGGSKVRKTD